jgi:methylenetetrahydrofolate--tRNA-(uracil-5-)-methyltransferase
LRKEDNENRLFNLVGFQTNLTFGEQKRVFSMIPGLNKAEFVRYGIMHRNSYINAPTVLNNTFSLKVDPKVFVAGQLSGVEGYLESTASGLIAAINAYNLLNGKEPFVLSDKTMIGSIINYITTANPVNFQPMNSNYGIIKPLDERVKDDKLKKAKYAERAIEELTQALKNMEE